MATLETFACENKSVFGRSEWPKTTQSCGGLAPWTRIILPLNNLELSVILRLSCQSSLALLIMLDVGEWKPCVKLLSKVPVGYSLSLNAGLYAPSWNITFFRLTPDPVSLGSALDNLGSRSSRKRSALKSEFNSAVAQAFAG